MTDDEEFPSWKGETWWSADTECERCGGMLRTNGTVLYCGECDETTPIDG